MKKALALLLVLAMVLSLVACGNQEPTSAPSGSDPGGQTQEATAKPTEAEKPKEYKKELAVGLEQPVTIYDPLEKTDNNHDKSYSMTHNQLLGYDFDKRELIPELATKWEAPDASTYTFWLREGVKFSNGETLDAEDVKYTFTDLAKKVEAEKGSVTSSTLVNYIESVDVDGPLQVTFHLNKPFADFLYYLYLYAYSIFNKEACEANWEEGVKIGTGGWILTNFVSGEECVYEQFKDSWVWKEEGECPTEKVTFRYYADNGTKMMAMETGEIVVAKTSEEAMLGIDTSKIKVVEYDAWTESYALFNYKYGVFAGDGEEAKNLRRAVIYAVNMDDLNQICFNGKGTQAKTLWGFAQLGLYDDYDRQYQQDIAYAKECLAKTSYPNGGFKIRLQVPNTSADSNWGLCAVAIQSMLKQNLNIDVEIVLGDTATVTAKVKAMREGTPSEQDLFDMLIYNISLRADGNRFNFVTNIKSGTNRALFENDRITELYNQAVSTTDEAARIAMYKEIQEIMHDYCVYWPWFYERLLDCYAEGVTGVVFRSDSKTDLHHIQMVIN